MTCSLRLLDPWYQRAVSSHWKWPVPTKAFSLRLCSASQKMKCQPADAPCSMGLTCPPMLGLGKSFRWLTKSIPNMCGCLPFVVLTQWCNKSTSVPQSSVKNSKKSDVMPCVNTWGVLWFIVIAFKRVSMRHGSGHKAVKGGGCLSCRNWLLSITPFLRLFEAAR